MNVITIECRYCDNTEDMFIEEMSGFDPNNLVQPVGTCHGCASPFDADGDEKPFNAAAVRASIKAKNP